MNKGLAPAGWAVLGAAAMGAALTATGLVGLGGRTAGGADEAQAAQAAPADGPTLVDGNIQLDAKDLAHAALRTETVAAGSTPNLIKGFARVMDLSALAAIDADRATARASLGASQAEAARLAALAAEDQSASRQAVEAARAKAAADATQVRLADRRVGLEFGPGVARMGAGAQAALVADAGMGRAALLRIDIAGPPLAAGTPVLVSDGPSSATVRVIGAAAVADAQLQNPSVLAVLHGPLAAAAMAGRLLTAAVADRGAVQGVIVPRAAMVRWQGQLWAYRVLGKGKFRRIAMADAQPVAQGWLVPHALAPGETVVTDGATTLLAIELGGSETQEDD